MKWPDSGATEKLARSKSALRILWQRQIEYQERDDYGQNRIDEDLNSGGVRLTDRLGEWSKTFPESRSP